MSEKNILFNMLSHDEPYFTYVIDESAQIHYINHNICNLLGYPLENMLEHSLFDFVHENDHYLIQQYLKNYSDYDLDQHFIEFRLENSNHDIVFVSVEKIQIEIINCKPFILHRINNISHQRQIEYRLTLLKNVFNNSRNAIIITDHHNNIVKVNPTFEHITGYTKEEVIGKNPRFLNSGRHDADFYRNMWEQLNATGSWSGEVWDCKKDGTIYPKWLSIVVLKNEHNAIENFIGEFSDISEQKQTQEQVNFLRYYDPLTALPNRLMLIERLKGLIEKHDYFSISDKDNHSSHQTNQIAVIVINLDRFKDINEMIGHVVADELFKAIAVRIRSSLDVSYIVSRGISDEFKIIKADTNRSEIAQQVKNLLKHLSEPYHLQALPEMPFPVSASIGISMYPEDGDSIDSLIKKARISMTHAKYLGRKTYYFFEQSLLAEYTENLHLEHQLREALKLKHNINSSQLKLYYQPKVNIKEQKVLSVEALLRWNHPKLGFISPAKFIPIAEETNLIIEMGDWIIEEACLQFKRWLDLGLPPIQIAVNISGNHFLQSNFIDKLKMILQKTNMTSHYLELEITESVFLSGDAKPIIQKFSEIRQMGLKLSLDDFGTGYSALNYLHQFPLDYLKIDQSFIRQMTSNLSMLMIVETIIHLAQRLGLKVVAEGVELPEEVDILKAHNCDQIQGYYYSKPIPADEFVKFYYEFLSKNQTKS